MKLQNLLLITVRSMNKVRWKIYLVCLICICSFFLIDQMSSNSFRFIFHRYELDKMLQFGNERTLQVQFHYIEETDDYVKSVNELMEYMEDIDGVYASGSYDEASVYFNELQENEEYKQINKKAYANTFRMETLGISEVFYVTPGMEQLCDLNILAGTKNFRELDTNDMIPVLVGYGYRDVLKIGTSLSIDGREKKYQIVGILEEGEKWYGDVDPIGTGVESLDYKFIVQRDQNEITNSDDIMTTLCLLSTSYLLINKQEDSARIEDAISEKAKQMGLSVSAEPMKKVLKEYGESYEKDMKISFVVTFVFAFFCIISISSSAVVSVLLRKSEFGIMYANGLSQKDVIWKIIFENTYLVLFSVCFAYILRTYAIIKNNISAFAVLMKQVHLQFTLPFLIAISILVIIIASLPPIIIMRRMKPVELIGGNN